MTYAQKRARGLCVECERPNAPFPSAIVRLHADGGDPMVVWGWRV